MYSIFNKLFKYLVDPYFRFSINASRGFYDHLSDEEFLKKAFKIRMGYELDLKNPCTFNEKLQWLKLHDRKPIYTTMVDKYEAKKYVANIIGEEHVIPTLGIWNSFNEIDFNKLPNQFVLKCTHDSGGLVICRDKELFDKKKAKIKLEKCLRRNYYYSSREWPYKDVKPRILAEKYMQDQNTINLPVDKIFNFMGKPELIQAIQDDKTIHETIDYFDTDWNKLDIYQNFPNSKISLNKPVKLAEMIKIARLLCEGFSFIRIDLYHINDNVFFSEFTFYSDSGLEKFHPEKWDSELGNLIELPDKIGGGYLVVRDDFILYYHHNRNHYDDSLNDYKFYCFNGEPMYLMVSSGEAQHLHINHKYDLNFKSIDAKFREQEIVPADTFTKPTNYDQMLEIVRALCKEISHVRVDLYNINGHIYFGELTFFTNGGYVNIPNALDIEIGSWIKLDMCQKKRNV